MSLAEEVERLAADEADRIEMRIVREQMAELARSSRRPPPVPDRPRSGHLSRLKAPRRESSSSRPLSWTRSGLLPDRQRPWTVVVTDGPILGHEAEAMLDGGRVDQPIGGIARKGRGQPDGRVRDRRGHAERA